MQGLTALGFPDGSPGPGQGGRLARVDPAALGGWGETCRSYDDPALKGTGSPTPSQTAWATLGLIAAGRASGEAARRGIDYLLETQFADGSWDEARFTGTGFPRVFYLRYHLYRVYFPADGDRTLPPGDRRPLGHSTAALACRIPAQPRPLD